MVRGAPGNYVYVINPDSTVSVRPINGSDRRSNGRRSLLHRPPASELSSTAPTRLRDGPCATRLVLPPPTIGHPSKALVRQSLSPKDQRIEIAQ